MAGRGKHYDTYQDLLRHFLALYYVMRAKIPGIKFDADKHAREVEKLNETYVAKLKKHYPDWLTEETEGQFKKEVEFLTNKELKPIIRKRHIPDEDRQEEIQAIH